MCASVSSSVSWGGDSSILLWEHYVNRYTQERARDQAGPPQSAIALASLFLGTLKTSVRAILGLFDFL